MNSGRKKEFVEFEGCVHLMSAAGDGEFTLCGVAQDAGSSEGQKEWVFKSTKERNVTCPICVREILNCRNVCITTGSKT